MTELTAREAAASAIVQIADLTAKKTVSATSVQKTDEGWDVGVEVVEDARIPSSTDLLACYRVSLDGGGNLLGYDRVRRYMRGRGES